MGRSPCCDKAHTNKGAWTREEDEILTAHIREHGEGCWRSLPKVAGLLRCGKSCRLRWINYLRPDLKRGNFTEEEDELIIQLHGLLGNKWSLIAGRLPGRSDNEIKNYWNTHIKRKLLSRGLDPQTHRPLNGGSISNFMATKHQHNLNMKEPYLSTARPATDFSDEGHSSSGASSDEDRHVDLNLDLSISLPHQSRKKSSAVENFSAASANAATVSATRSYTINTTGSGTSVVCLCYRLGSWSGEAACSCTRRIPNQHAFRFIRPLEGGQHIDYSVV